MISCQSIQTLQKKFSNIAKLPRQKEACAEYVKLQKARMRDENGEVLEVDIQE